MSESNEHPKVFLSYSRTNQKHNEKVFEFCSTLRTDGIDAKIDETELKIGNDLNYFMENNIKNESDYVLVILDKEFVRKANERKSGVGTETQIISKEVYEDVTQERIIPIVWECDETGKPYLPTFLESRYYIDLSSNEKFGENYETLLRTLYNKPKNPKEDLGEMPEWLNDNNKYYPTTSEIVKRFSYSIDHTPEKINQLIEEFCDEYYEYLITFTIEFSSNNNTTVATEIYNNLEQYSQLKKDFEDFTEILTKKGKYKNIDYDIIIEFLINVHSLTVSSRNRQSHYIYDFYNFDFILQEIFLYFIAYGLKNKDYELISVLLNNPYYLKGNIYEQKYIQYFIEFNVLGQYTVENYLDHYYRTVKEKRYSSPMSILLIERLPTKLNEIYLVDADLLCCYVSCLNIDKYNQEFWFPHTHINKERNDSFELFRRMTSAKHFEKVKKIFDVETIEEFKNKVIATRETILGRGKIGHENSIPFNNVKPIEKYINLDKISSEK